MARSAGLLIIVVLLGAGLAAAKSQSRSSSQGRPAASRSGAKIKAAGKRTAKTRPTITVRPVAARQPMAKDELDQRESGEGTDDVQAEPELPDPQENSLNIQEPEILDPDVPFDDRRMYITPDEIRRRIRPLRELTIDRAPPEGPLPWDMFDRTYPKSAPGIGPDYARTSTGMLFAWEAPGMAHYPLYFEDVRLERYGQTLRALYPCAQPFASAALFWGSIPSVPFQMVFDRPCECMFPLGYYRPGNMPGAWPGKYHMRLPCYDCRK